MACNDERCGRAHPWLMDTDSSQTAVAEAVKADLAVRHALTEPWSNGQTEGQSSSWVNETN